MEERRRSAVSLPDLLTWPEQPVASQRMPTEVGEKIEQGVAGRKFAGEDLCDPLEKRAGGWRWKVIYGGDGISKTGGLELKERQCSAVSLPGWRGTQILYDVNLVKLSLLVPFIFG